jgi:uridine phosphorylase
VRHLLRHATPPNHLRPACELAERVLLPGDPGRALAVAQHLLEAPRMFNHTRGLWGYTGVAADGQRLTVQATGMGGPSAAIVCEELVALGARRLVRIGTCGSLSGELALGALLAAETVLPGDGVSAALGADGALAPDPVLLAALVEAGARPATVASSDLFYDPDVDDPHADDPRSPGRESLVGRGALAVDMESAAILRVAQRAGARAAAVLAVTSSPSGHESLRSQPDALEDIALRLGEAGYAALRTR